MSNIIDLVLCNYKWLNCEWNTCLELYKFSWRINFCIRKNNICNKSYVLDIEFIYVCAILWTKKFIDIIILDLWKKFIPLPLSDIMKAMQLKSSPRRHWTKFGRLNFPRKSKPLCGTFSMMPSQLEQSSVKEDYRSQALVLFATRGRKLYHISFCTATLLRQYG